LAQRHSSPRPTAIINPASASGRTYRRWERLKAFLLSYFREIKERFTEGPRHATEIAKEELREGQTHIISVGGDGTLNEVANGFFEEGKPINPEAGLSVLPSGRGNDFAKGLGIRRKALSFSRNLWVDLVSMGERFFVNVMDLGLGGEIVSRLSQGTHSGVVYSLKLLREFFRYKPKYYEVEVDGESFSGEFLTVAVANGSVFGGGMRIAPSASPSDGLLDVVAIGSLSPGEFLLSLPRLYLGSLLSHPKVLHFRGKEVRIRTELQFGEYDGEIFRASEVSLKIRPGLLRMVV